jgi:hypothetical protein
MKIMKWKGREGNKQGKKNNIQEKINKNNLVLHI